MTRTFIIRSLGCKVSQYDGDRIGEMLIRLGLEPAGAAEIPDLFVLNTCSVTGRASQKGRQALRAARKAWPPARIVLAGCETALLEKTGDRPVEVDGMLPLNPTLEIVEILLGRLGLLDRTTMPDEGATGMRQDGPVGERGVPVVRPSPLPGFEPSPVVPPGRGLPGGGSSAARAADTPPDDPIPARPADPAVDFPTDPPLAARISADSAGPDRHEVGSGPRAPRRGLPRGPILNSVAEAPQIHGDSAGRSRTRAFLKIQDGCNQFCSYCIVPHLRGRERSRPLDDVVAEARDLARRGFREIVLTGIHLGRFEPGLVPLLRDLERIDGLVRIRLSSIEPLEVTDDLIDWLATSPAACPHLHLPLQAGTDTVLRAMNRPYTIGQFAAVVARVRERLPRAGVTTDLIVGFPGESDALFREGLAFVERMAFSRIHIFRFSARPGTSAATMAGRVGNVEKQARAKAAEQVWHASAEAFHRSLVGHEVEVLWETRVDGLWHGHSREYVPCTRPDGLGQVAANSISRHRAVSATAEGLEVI